MILTQPVEKLSLGPFLVQTQLMCEEMMWDHPNWEPTLCRLNSTIRSRASMHKGDLNSLLLIFNSLKLEDPTKFAQVRASLPSFAAFHNQSEHWNTRFDHSRNRERRLTWKNSFESQALSFLSEHYTVGIEEYRNGVSSFDYYLPESRLCIELDGSSHFYGRSRHRL